MVDAADPAGQLGFLHSRLDDLGVFTDGCLEDAPTASADDDSVLAQTYTLYVVIRINHCLLRIYVLSQIECLQLIQSFYVRISFRQQPP